MRTCPQFQQCLPEDHGLASPGLQPFEDDWCPPRIPKTYPTAPILNDGRERPCRRHDRTNLLIESGSPHFSLNRRSVWHAVRLRRLRTAIHRGRQGHKQQRSSTRRQGRGLKPASRQDRLIIRHAAGWARSKQDLRTRAACTVGVDGYLVDRAHRYSVERETWQWWLAELTTMNSSPSSRPRRQHVSSRPLFEAEISGERTWPRYPRSADRRADHKSARSLVFDGVLNPESRFQYLGDAA